MRRMRWRFWLTRGGPGLGLLFVAGCLARMENNLDLVLASGAVANALLLPYGGLARLAEFFSRLTGG